MKARNILQALWPAFWLLASGYFFFRRGQAWTKPVVPLAPLWLSCALLLHPRRPWSWWACLAPLAFAACVGLLVLGSLGLMAVYPDFKEALGLPAWFMLVGGSFYLLPAVLLLWHLVAIRGEFRRSTNA